MALPVLSVALDPICRLLASGRFDLSNEKAAQADIHGLLVAMLPPGFEVEREARLSPRDIPDFLIASQVVVEVKIKRATRNQAFGQVCRYAEHDLVTGIIVASNKAMLLPDHIHGKPVRFVSLGRAWL